MKLSISMLDPIVDPVTGFKIPQLWIDLCSDSLVLEKISSGRWVLLSNGKLLRRGLTTGTTAAAACKGALLSLRSPVESVEVLTPVGLEVSLPVVAKDGFCMAVKDSGDHQFDITNGMEIISVAKLSKKTELVLGKGVGRISATGLCAPLGKQAISPSAKCQILKAIQEGLQATGFEGARVELNVPQGEILALKTLNPKVGVTNGISILGTTGFVEPWNEHLVENRMGEIRNAGKVVVTTGRTGLKFSHILFPDHYAILIGGQLNRLKFENGQESILCGLPALILKWAWPEILGGTSYSTVAGLIEMEPDHENIALALKEAKKKLPKTRIVLILKDGSIFRDLQ